MAGRKSHRRLISLQSVEAMVDSEPTVVASVWCLLEIRSKHEIRSKPMGSGYGSS
jgi:hypothetical protein